MKSLRLLVAVLCTGCLPVFANEASMSIANLSIRTQATTASDVTGAAFRMEFTSDVTEALEPISFNGEWYLTSGTVGYESIFQIENLETGEMETGILSIEIPSAGDANLNYLTDFFEVDRPVQQKLTADLLVGDAAVPVSAVWNRQAGEATGTVQLSISGYPQSAIGELLFDVPFEVFEYRGTLTYTPPTAVGTPIEASINLARVGVPDERFAGPYPLRLAADGTLIRQATRWAGPGGIDFDVLGSFDIEDVPFVLSRIPRRPRYLGSFFLVDGDPTTPFPDEYDVFDVFIADPNDTDHDGLPDLTDPADIPPPVVTPEVRLQVADGNLLLEVKAKAGVRVSIENRPSLSTGEWTAVQSFTLANDSESLALSGAEGNSGFWRVTTP